MNKAKIKKTKELYSSKLNKSNSTKNYASQPFFSKLMEKLENKQSK